MRDDTPSVYVLTGPAGRAKAAYAHALAEHGVIAVAAGTPEETSNILAAHVEAGRDAFIDHDVDAATRDRYKALVEELGGEWCSINFTVDHGPLADRLEGTTDRG
jgi:NADP-dependent 3-hydroxy acid dehydrogenase YdfG